MGDLYGLIGRNIGYSKSPELFRAFFEQYGLTNSYELFDLADITEIERILQLPGLKGFNVTIPYKSQIMAYLNKIDPEAAMLQSVNTVKVETDGKLTGYNTDIFGFETAVKKFLEPYHNKALILGNGATAGTVRYVLEKLHIDYFIVSRSRKPGILTYDDIRPGLLQETLLVINTTPLGNLNHAGQKPLIPYDAIGPKHFLFDLNYNPAITPFMEEGIRRNARVQNGLRMLELQARKALEIWTGIPTEY